MKKLSALYRRAADWLERCLNDLSLRKKLRALYYFCILFPIMLTDGIILYSLVSAEEAELRHDMESEASAVQYSMTTSLENSAVVAKSLYMNDSLQAFLDTQYESPEHYVRVYQDFLRGSLVEGISGIDNTVITVYVDNDTFVNGGGFLQRSDADGSVWYEEYADSPLDAMLLFYYDREAGSGRSASFLRSLDRTVSGGKTDRFVKIDLDYSGLARNISRLNYSFPVYVCLDNIVLITNAGPNNYYEQFEEFTLEDEVSYEKAFELYGAELRICVLRRNNTVLTAMRANLGVLVLLLLFNIVSPLVLTNLLARSISGRIYRLGQVFDQVDSDTLIKIPDRGGRDEIGGLIDNYNRMADRMNGLIETVYRNRLREQEMDIARQNAELLALYSQINPHFLFNALESIRMHSILKEEYETAGMVEKLAVMERQNVDWSTDTNAVKRELEFVDAYLALQKYRFGERLSYRIEVQKECETILVPKLTVTTFVENACVHGVETKTSPCWVFVRVYIEDGNLCIEVEDTGGGMEEDEVERICSQMRNASIDMLKGKGRVGMVNACLRIRMMTDDTAQFSVESEKGIGTVILIRIPLEKTERAE